VKFLLTLACVTSAAGAQQDAARIASDAWNARDWARAADAYAEVSKTDTTMPLPHMRRGVALTALGRYAEARKEIELAEAKGGFIGQSAFRLAAIEAGLGNVDKAFTQLKRATDAGLPMVPNPGDSFPVMAKLKSDSRYASFITDLDRNARPCMYDEKTKEFDFWVGSWDVRPRLAPLNPPARSDITKTNEGCVVHESWHGLGNSGESYNIYDRSRQKWFQYWVDNFGGLHEYAGVYSDNAMRYEGTTPAGPGTPGRVATRLTFFKIAADTVRQFSESQQPNGTWSTNYDFIYTRRK